MDNRDAVELARNIQPAGYNDWFDVTEGLIYQTCCDCGLSHGIMIKETGPNMQRIRFVAEEELTQASRENDNLELPLYREVLRLREENAQLKRDLKEANFILEGLRK